MSEKRSKLLSIYRIATAALAPTAPLLLDWRRRRGKEDPDRLRERLGFAGLTRPQGQLAWLHGASVGESLALLPVVERLLARGVRVLITTGTTSSAAILKARLPAGAAHQFVPLDAPRFVRRFLDHWRPDLALIAESELWPNLLHETHVRSIPLALVNARLSQRSHDRWLRFPGVIAEMLGTIDLCLAQTHEDAIRLARLGARRVQVAGNLKYDALAPPVDAGELARLRALIGARPVWLAASTHPGEEQVVAEVHARLASKMPGLLTILAPRHARRGGEIVDVLQRRGVRGVLRSAGGEIDAAVDCYVADTMGEMGLFYRLASVVFVGRSLAGATGGQNPIEPAKLGAAVLHGPDVLNFDEVYRALDAAGGSWRVEDAADLTDALAQLFSNPQMLRQMARAAGETVEKLGGATNAILQALEPYIMQLQVERAADAGA